MKFSPERVASIGLEHIDNFFDEVFAILTAWAPSVKRDIEQQLQNGYLTSGQLADLVEEGSVNILKETTLPIYGAGFCASEKVIDQGNPLAWWQGENHEPLASSTFGVGPGAVDLRRLEWYRVPEISLKPNVAGPFVDYLCSNEVTITSSLPLIIGGEFAGVLCLDVLVIELEEALSKKLDHGFLTTVINSNRRVVLSSDHHLQTGDKFSLETLQSADVSISTSVRHPFSVIVQ